MVFSCEKCGYETSRKIDSARHQKRKYPCKPKLGNHNTINESPRKVTPESQKVTPESQKVTPGSQKVTPGSQKVTPESQKVTPGSQKVTPGSQKVTPEPQTLPINNNTCSKCGRCFARKDSLTRHLLTCDGLHPLQCRICLKIFARKQSKYKHKLYVKCVSPPSSTTQIINNEITYILT